MNLFKVDVIAILLTLGLILTPISQAKADPSKEFAMSCTYGVLAGALVGAATLAFTAQPGENLRNIARGASLGLYAGILLGAYVVYLVPNQGDEEESTESSSEAHFHSSPTPQESRVSLAPTFSETTLQVDGLIVFWKPLTF